MKTRRTMLLILLALAFSIGLPTIGYSKTFTCSGLAQADSSYVWAARFKLNPWPAPTGSFKLAEILGFGDGSTGGPFYSTGSYSTTPNGTLEFQNLAIEAFPVNNYQGLLLVVVTKGMIFEGQCWSK